MTQARLADLMAVKPQTINAIMTAKDVRTSTVERISSVTNKPVSFFFNEFQDKNHVVAHGDHSVAAVQSTVTKGDYALLDERVKFYEEAIAEKDARIAELKERIGELKERIAELKNN